MKKWIMVILSIIMTLALPVLAEAGDRDTDQGTELKNIEVKIPGT